MAVCSLNGDGEDFSFMFRGSSCQGNFFCGAEKLHYLNHNFAMSNVVVEMFYRVKGAFAMTVCSKAGAKAYI